MISKIGIFSFDKNNDVNKGVISFTLVSVNSQALRCIRYRCPDTGTEYTFITSLTDVEPGIIAMLYKARWNIEKIFDETKNKLNQKKSWATSKNAKTIQALFVCMLHNLMLLMHRNLEASSPLPNHDAKIRKNRCDAAQKQAARRKRRHARVVLRFYERSSLIGLRFIRWLRNFFDARKRWKDLVNILYKEMAAEWG